MNSLHGGVIIQAVSVDVVFQVFSEKMGLEAGWNCHISLLNDTTENKLESTMPQMSNDANHPTKERRFSLQPSAKAIKRHSDVPPALKPCRRSAPSALNMEEGTQVTFSSTHAHEVKCSSGLNSFFGFVFVSCKAASTLISPLVHSFAGQI